MIRKRSRTKWVILFLGIALAAACAQNDALHQIKQSGVVTVLTRNNAHCYYIYRDKLCGFEYDLAKAFSEYLGVKLKVMTPEWGEINKMLIQDKGDFVAASLSICPSREQHLDFSDPYMTVQQKVIIHKTNLRINGIEDLNGKTVHVRRGTSYHTRLKELRQEGLNIHIRLHNDLPTEEFIRMVAEKEIEITVADSNIALLNRRYYPDVRIAFPIEEPQSLGWGVKKGETALMGKINDFFKQIDENGTFAKLHEKYYADVEIFDYVDLKKFHLRIETRLPKYSEMIKEAARDQGFDWRLIAAMAYQESHFNPKAKSYTGVEGIMQLTQDTAREMGIEDRNDPRQSIMAGVRYLKKLYDRYDAAKDPDRLLIALAGYNVGHGHILDAQQIAKQRGFNPNSWSSLQRILPLLRYPSTYEKTTYGYCRGTEPIRYVSRILTYYDILKKDAIDNHDTVQPQA